MIFILLLELFAVRMEILAKLVTANWIIFNAFQPGGPVLKNSRIPLSFVFLAVQFASPYLQFDQYP